MPITSQAARASLRAPRVERANTPVRVTMLRALASLALLASFAAAANAQDDTIAGKKVSEWVKILKTHKEVKFRRAAVIALEVAGPKVKNVLDTLLEGLAKDSEPELRREIAMCLDRMGLDAKGAVESLGEALKKDKSEVVREAAARALARGLKDLAHTQVFILAGALKDSHQGTRATAAEALHNLGEKAKPVLDQITAAGKDVKNDRFTRLYCVQIVAKWGDMLAGPPLLLQVAKESDAPAGLREAALEGLSLLAPDHMETAELMTAALEDKQIAVRRAAAGALAKMADKADPVWPAIKKGLQDSDAQVRYQLYRVAGNLAKSQKEAVGLLLQAAKKDVTVENRLAAILELGELGALAMSVLKDLEEFAENESRPQLREAAQVAVKKIKAASN